MEKISLKQRFQNAYKALTVQNLDKKQPHKSVFPREFKDWREQQITRARQTIADWRCALEEWEDTEDSDRGDLLDIYHDAILDCHVISVINTRVNKTSNKDFKIVDKDKKVDEEATRLLKSKWFKNFVKSALSSKFWGFTLIQMGDIKDDKFQKAKPVNRYHVQPEKNLVSYEANGIEGIDYTKKPQSYWLVPVGDEMEFGLLVQVSLMYLYKKWTLNALNEFLEIYGQPIRLGKTDINDQEGFSNMVEMVRDMGANTWAVLKREDEIQLVEGVKGINGQTPHEFFNRFCDEQISKAILGQTMTTDDGSSQSQANVHENVLNDIIKDDSQDIEFLVNDELLPRMRTLGFPIAKDRFFMYNDDEVISMLDRSTIDKNLSDMGVTLTTEYLEDQYKVEIDEEAMEAKKAAEEQARASAASKDIVDLMSDLNVQ